MKITKRQLKRIIREERNRLLHEGSASGDPEGLAQTDQEHHWPRVDWTNVEDLVDKWMDGELDAFDKGDPSMTAMGDTIADAKQAWKDQVEAAAMDMEAELTTRVRKLALETMQEFTNKLINGEY